MKNANLLLRSRVSAWAFFLAAVGFFVQPASATLRSWTGAGANANWGTTANWAPAGTPQDGDDLVFPAGAARLVNTNSLAFRRFNSITFNGSGGGYVLRGAGFSLNAGISAQNTSGTNTIDIILSLYSADQTYATTTANGALVIATNVNLNGHNLTLNVNRAPMRMSGIISGTGNLTKTGTGPLTLDGPGPNTYTGSFTMTDGSLELGKVPGPAVTGNLTASCEPFSHHVQLAADDQLSDTGVVALDGVWLLMEGFSDTVGPLDLRGSRVFTGGGLLTLNGNVTNRCWPIPTMIPGVSTIEGRLNLGSATRVFDLSDPCPDSGYNILEIPAVIEGPLTAPSPGILVRGGGSLELSGNNTFYGTTTVEGNLTLNSDTALGDVLGGTVINTNGRIILMGVTLGNESLTVNAPGSLAVQFSSSLAGSITLNADLELTVYEPNSLTLSGAISGAGGLTCQRPGEVWLSGTTANSYSGVTTVNGGTLALSKPGLVAVPGPLVISDGHGVATVRLTQVNQIANTSAVRVNSYGLLLLEGPSSDTIGSLTLEGGTVRTETGTLTLNGDVTARAGNEDQPAQIAGKLSLGSATRRFHLDRIEPAWVILEVDAAVSGTGGLTFTGTGQLNLNSSNSYAGLTTVAGEVLRMGHAYALGSTSAGTVVSNGACLLLPGDISVGAEPLTLNGTGPTSLYGSLRSWGDNSWAGPITLTSASLIAAYSTNNVLTLSGVISGPGSLTKEGTGTLVLAGASANTFAGATYVNSGTLRLAKSSGYAVPAGLVVGDGLGGPGADIARYHAADQVDNDFATINSSGLLDLNGYLGSLGQITLNGGRITTGLGTLWQYEPITVNAHTSQIASIEGRLLLNGNGWITVAGHHLVPDIEISAFIYGTRSLTKDGSGYLSLAGSNAYSGFTHVNEGVLVVDHSWALGDTSQGTFVFSNAVLSLRQDSHVPDEPLWLASAAYPAFQSLFGSNSWAGSVTLARDTTIWVRTNDWLNLSGAVSGPAGFTKTGPGTLLLSGITTNTYAGSTRLHEGALELAKTGAGTDKAISAGSLTIGDEGGGTEADRVRYLNGYQIGGIPITVVESGLLDLNNFNDLLGPVTLQGGHITTGTGLLTLGDDLTVPASAGLAEIEGRLSLGSDACTFNVARGPIAVNLAIPASITDVGDNASLTITGGGDVSFEGSNSFRGILTIEEGALRFYESTGLGTTNGGTIVNTNGDLSAHTVDVGHESLTINTRRQINFYGPSSWAGPITIGDNPFYAWMSGEVRFTGSLSGLGSLYKEGNGTLVFEGDTTNTYAGSTYVCGGTLLLNRNGIDAAVPGSLIIGYPHGVSITGLVRVARSEQIGDDAEVEIRGLGKLEFAADGWEVIDRLTGSGDLELGSLDLYVGRNNYSNTFSGTISGGPASEFHKTGTGRLTLAGTSPLRGTTYVDAGTLRVNGQLSSNIVQVGFDGTLGGSGIVGTVMAQGTVSPGTSPGILTSSHLNLNAGSDLFIELNGSAPGTGYDQLNVRGSNFLESPFLRVSAPSPPAEGESFVILQNDGTGPINGTFAGLPEGALTTASNGLPLRVSYRGGDGNDITLTVAPLALAVASARVEAGNGNGVIDPDECNLLSVILTNLTQQQVDSIATVLQSTNPAVTIPDGSFDYPSIPAGGTGTNRLPCQVMTSPTLPCGQPVEMQIRVYTSDQGDFRLAFTLPTGLAGDPRRMDQNTKAPIPDGGSATSSVMVARMPMLATATVAVHIEHPRADELDLHLIAPDGTKIELSTDNGRDANYGTSCEDKDRTWFDDESPRPITAGTAPFVGRFKPESPLAAVRGKSGAAINGAWKLVVADDTPNANSGTLWCWSLFLHPLSCPNGGGPCELCPSYFDIRGALTSSDPVQAGQLQSNGMASACGSARSCPGLQDTFPRRYDAYRFANGPTAACIEVELLSLCGNQVFSAAYFGTFEETAPCADYLADGGGTGSRSYAFDVAPDSLFTVVVSDALTNASCEGYVLRVHGGDCRPALHIAPAGASQAVLDWTSSAVGYGLEGTPTLAPSDFQPVLPLPVVLDGRNTVTNPVVSPTRFYRLHKP